MFAFVYLLTADLSGICICSTDLACIICEVYLACKTCVTYLTATNLFWVRTVQRLRMCPLKRNTCRPGSHDRAHSVLRPVLRNHMHSKSTLSKYKRPARHPAVPRPTSALTWPPAALNEVKQAQHSTSSQRPQRNAC